MVQRNDTRFLNYCLDRYIKKNIAYCQWIASEKDTEAYCSAKVKIEQIYIIIQIRQTFAHVHIKHLSHFCLSLAFFRNVSLLQRTPVTASQGQNPVHGIDVLKQPYLVVLLGCWLPQEHLMKLVHLIYLVHISRLWSKMLKFAQNS